MACCRDRKTGEPRQRKVNVSVVVHVESGEVESVWPSWHEARFRAGQLGSGFRPQQRKLDLDTSMVGDVAVTRSCCGH